jgi:hypothetical protein
MSDANIQTVMDTQNVANMITNFLYIDGKARNGVKSDLTNEQCLDMLKRVESYLYDSYTEAARFLGWID